MKTYCIDIDGTLCHTQGSDYENSVPIIERIRVVNQLFESGNKIILFTARGSTTGKNWRETTEKQLNSWGLEYHELILGKPFADYYIDDKGIRDSDFFRLA
jgi:carbamoyl-phosphate synthase large subunit